MSGYFVRVAGHEFEHGTDDLLLGPFRTYESAERFAGKVTARVKDPQVYASVNVLTPPTIRAVREAGFLMAPDND